MTIHTVGNRSKRPHFFPKINHYKKKYFCDSNVYKCLPGIRFCSNILFLFYYIFINLFIKIINLINDDCIKLNLYVSLIITIIICLYRCRWSLMSLITGKNVKTRYCEKQMYKANKRILRSLSFDNNGLIFSEYCKFFIFCYIN